MPVWGEIVVAHILGQFRHGSPITPHTCLTEETPGLASGATMHPYNGRTSFSKQGTWMNGHKLLRQLFEWNQ